MPDPTPQPPPLPEPSHGSIVAAVAALLVGTLVIALLAAAVVTALVLGARQLGRPSHPPQATAPPAAVVPAPSPSVPAEPRVAPAAPSPAAPVVPAPPPAVLPAEAGPWVGSISPTTGGVGQTVVLQGRHLAGVEDVVLFPQHGGAYLDTATFDVTEDRITFPIPAVDKPDGYQPGDGYYVAVFAKTGACLLGGPSLTAPPPGPPPSHAAVHVGPAAPFVGGDHLLVFADPGSTVTVGDNCVVFLARNCTLGGYGTGCKVFYQRPLHTTGDTPADGVAVNGVTALPSVRLDRHGERLVLDPLKPAADPADATN